MTLPPSAMLDTVSGTDGIQGFASDATGLEIFGSLAFVVLSLYIAYIIGKFFDLGLSTVINFCTAAYTTSINFCTTVYTITSAWATYSYQHIPTIRNLRAFPKCLLTSISLVFKATFRFMSDTSALLPWLWRTLLANVVPSTAIGVNTLALPGRSTIAVIHGLPSGISGPELRRYLARALWKQYGDEVCHNATSSGNVGKEEARHQGPTHLGLWKGTCVREGAEDISTAPAANVDAGASSVSRTSSGAEVSVGESLGECGIDDAPVQH
ncbi:hypothetical protein SVAN01_11198 [Stagonosporopsis vannaccii]|nr:hypothetical protein SVAN01_11198 [Stagonosporopsis vannaccii]